VVEIVNRNDLQNRSMYTKSSAMSTQNTFSALQTLAFQAKFTMRRFVLGVGPDQDNNTHSIEPTHRAVNGNALDLGCIAFGFGNISGAGSKPHDGQASGKVLARFPFQLEGNQYDH
jgi:hypothetical protein